MKCASRRSIASARTPIRMEIKPAHKSMAFGCLAEVPLSTAECAPPNIGAVKSAIPLNFLDSGISAGLGFSHGFAQGRDIQHPPANGDDITAALFGAGVKDGDSGESCGQVQAGNDM